MACDAQKQAVTDQQNLVNEIMAAVVITKNQLNSQLQTLNTELAILNTRHNELRTCLGG